MSDAKNVRSWGNRGAAPHRQTGVFVFLDHDSFWHSFHQVAALVRRNGIQSIRITTAETGRLERLAQSLLYARCYYLPDIAEWEHLPKLLEPFTVSQVFLTEPMMVGLPDRLYDSFPPAVADDVRRRVRFSDKARAASFAAALGVDTPEQLPACAVTPTAAAERLGLPLVVKANLGASGAGVVIARTVADIERAVAALDLGRGCFFERYVAGQIVSYAGAVLQGQIVQDMTYRAVKFPTDPTCAPLAFEVVADEALLGAGRVLCQALNLNGPINLQSIRDATGRHWLIDLNLRPYGPMLSFEQDKVDTAAAFLYATGISSTCPRQRTAVPGTRVEAFPYDAETLMRCGQPWRAVGLYLRRSSTFCRTLGAKYVLYVFLAAAAHRADVVWARTRKKSGTKISELTSVVTAARKTLDAPHRPNSSA